MALQVWLPFTNTNTSKNQGVLGDLTVTTSPSIVTGGKLGNALKGGAYKMSAAQTAQCLNNKEVSIAFWIKPTTSSSNHIIFGEDGFRQFTIFAYSGKNDLHISWANSTGAYALEKIYSNALPFDKWTHCCITYNNPTVTIYLNGELFKTETYTCDITDFAKETRVIHNDAGRYINDFRIYNHCLSAKEVKEISKGLVLHYLMNNHTAVAVNLLNNAEKYRMGTEVSQSTTSSDGYFYLSDLYYNNDSLAGKTVTFSVCTDRPIAPSHGGSASTHNKVGLWLYLNTSAYNGSTSIYTTPVNLNSSDNTFKSLGGNRYSWTYTVPSGIKGLMIRTNLYSNDGTSVSAKFWDFQLEEGSYPSPFTTNKSTTSVVYDCSGFNNNGVVAVGQITTNSDSPRYTSSIQFNGSSAINAGQNAKITDSLSICWWGYMDNWGNYGRAASCTESGGWNFEPISNKMSFTALISNSYRNLLDTVDLASLSAGWHHWCGTYDQSNLKLYRDGSLISTMAVSGTSVTYNTTNSIIIGGEATNDGITTPYFTGKMSDFRIYATALSESDIKDLYSTSAVVCDNGTVMAYSLEE